MPVPPNKRATYDSLGGDGDDFNRLWDETQAADDGFDPVPNGVYRCLVSDGRMSQAKSGTKSYKLTFMVIEGEYANRKLWLDLWLSPRALSMSKRDLSKLRIHRPEQLHQAPPTGIVCDVRVVAETRDNGMKFNSVKGFTVIADAPPPGTLDEDDDQHNEGDNDANPEVPF